MTPDTDVLLLVFLFHIGRCSRGPDPFTLRGLLSLALSLEDQYDRITTLPSTVHMTCLNYSLNRIV